MKEFELDINERNRNSAWTPSNVKNFIEENYMQKATAQEKALIRKLIDATDAEINYVLKEVGKKANFNKINFHTSSHAIRTLMLLNGAEFKYRKKIFSKNQCNNLRNYFREI